MMKKLFVSLLPVMILVLLSAFCSVLAYYILRVLGDVAELRSLISRTVQVMLILSIFPLRARLKMTWSELGFVPPLVFAREMGQGLLLGIVTLLPVLLLLFGLDIHELDLDRNWTLWRILKSVAISLLLALLISFAEEPLFRGMLLAGFKRKLGVSLAIFLSSFYYAALHFLKNKTNVPYEKLEFSSGFRLLAETYGNWLNPEIIPAFLALLVVGIFLALLRTEFGGSLGLCVGCHAGWVWQIKVSKEMFNTNTQSEYLYLVSSYDGVVGPLITVWLSMAMLAYFIWHKYTCRNA